MRPVIHAHCCRARIRRSLATPCQVVRERDFALVGSVALDLSARGMLIATKLPILTGEDVVITFRNPSSCRWFDRVGTVARVLHGRRRSDRTRAVGIAFESTDVWSDLCLCHELRGAPIVAQRGLGSHVAARRG